MRGSTFTTNASLNFIEWLSTVGTNVFSNFIFVILTIFFGRILYILLDRMKIKNFFGLENYEVISVFLARIRPASGNRATSISGGPAPLYSDSIVYDEFIEAVRLREKFNLLIPALSDQPSLLSKLLVSDIKIDIVPSVLHTNEIPSLNTIIAVGGWTYNLVSDHVQNFQGSKVKVTDKIYFDNLITYEDNNIGFVQRIFDKDRCLFLTAGLSTDSTVGALSYLIDNWKQLHKEFGNKNFIVFLKFSPSNSKKVIDIAFKKDWYS